MKRIIKPVTVFISCLLVFGTIMASINLTPRSSVMNSSDRLEQRTLDPYHIEIDNVDTAGDFLGWATMGTGAPDNPFVIEDLHLDLSSDNKGGIQVFDSELYFIIRNCTFIGSGLYRGIEIWGAHNGNITNNTIIGFRYGIEISGHSGKYAENFNITDNIVSGNDRDNLLMDNILSQSHFIRVINNTFDGSANQRGASINKAYNCTFIGNTFNQNAGYG